MILVCGNFKDYQMKYNKTLIFYVLIMLTLMVWAVLRGEFGQKFVNWLVIIIPITLLVIYWRFKIARKPIKKVYDFLVDLIVSFFKDEKKDSNSNRKNKKND